MNIQITINEEIYNANKIDDENNFSYIDSLSCINKICINEEIITINRKGHDHSTMLSFGSQSFCEISSEEGKFSFELKNVAINKNFDIISIVYTINDEQKKIQIRYLGDR